MSEETVNVELRDRMARRLHYERGIRFNIREFIEGRLTFAEMTRACDGFRDWYHCVGNYRERVLADPVTYGHATKKGR